MLEAQAHSHLKTLLRQGESNWPHHLTLSRLVGRSLRRGDRTLLRLAPNQRERWWLGLLMPLCLQPSSAVLVLSAQQRQRLLQVERPRLARQGFRLACWEGNTPPPQDQLWLLDHAGLIQAHRNDLLGDRQLLLPGIDQLSEQLRRCMAIRLDASHWEQLRLALPQAEKPLLELHERLSRQLFREAPRVDACIRLDNSACQSLRDLLAVMGPCPSPWSELLACDPREWSNWAELDHTMLQWSWCLEPLEPLQQLQGLLSQRPTLMLSDSGDSARLEQELQEANASPTVTAVLREAELEEPLPLFAPRRQPLPNTEIYAEHLLEQSRRLILGRPGLTVLLLDDPSLRRSLTASLAAEFGTRVQDECTAPEDNGVISGSWSWWLQHLDQLPEPEQIIIGLLPIASLTSPITAARVERLKSQGADWFRSLLLPEALRQIPAAVAPLRRSGGRLAVLDGRLRGRSWGDQVLQRLEPWRPLQRLLPD
ncbi:ATP-dependent helicase C-terminal domain-containing protein [Synechococcus sp. RS9915]|nr:ATP-dependent helicase C-terminal domain-containing protein [Synechococcus sp. RS9915]